MNELCQIVKHATAIIAEVPFAEAQNFLYRALFLDENDSEYLKLLDRESTDWQSVWKEHRDEMLSGHFFLTRPTAYTLPKPVVGAIKTGLRRDDPHYNATSGNVERQLMDKIMRKWGKEKQEEEYKKQRLHEQERDYFRKDSRMLNTANKSVLPRTMRRL